MSVLIDLLRSCLQDFCPEKRYISFRFWPLCFGCSAWDLNYGLCILELYTHCCFLSAHAHSEKRQSNTSRITCSATARLYTRAVPYPGLSQNGKGCLFVSTALRRHPSLATNLVTRIPSPLSSFPPPSSFWVYCRMFHVDKLVESTRTRRQNR